MRATLEHVLTDAAFTHMIDLATRFTAGVRDTIDAAGVPWSVAQLGARSEYRFAAPAPRTGTASAASADDELDEYLHLYLVNRGVLITPFHNMALMCPETSIADVDRHTELFAAAVSELTGAS
jgi:glutamate-1-semialdehyde 2,1-aminomutase